jgi:hypothetical protein
VKVSTFYYAGQAKNFLLLTGGWDIIISTNLPDFELNFSQVEMMAVVAVAEVLFVYDVLIYTNFWVLSCCPS